MCKDLCEIVYGFPFEFVFVQILHAEGLVLAVFGELEGFLGLLKIRVG